MVVLCGLGYGQSGTGALCFQARTLVSRSPDGEQLLQRNQAHFVLRSAISNPGWTAARCASCHWSSTRALIVGPAQEYRRARLSGRVSTPPAQLAAELADAAYGGRWSG